MKKWSNWSDCFSVIADAVLLMVFTAFVLSGIWNLVMAVLP